MCCVFLGSVLCVGVLMTNPQLSPLKWARVYCPLPPVMTHKQDGEPPERQLVLACLLVRWLLLS